MKKLFIIGLMIATMTAGCSKDWLKPRPLSIYTSDNVYTDKNGFEATLINLRKDLRADFYGAPSNLAFGYMTSEFGVAGETKSGMAQNFDVGVTPTGETGFFNNWNAAWGPIRDANIIISNVDQANWNSDEEKNKVLGEAYFHRAFWYYLLVHQYGDVPFINVAHSSPKTDFHTNSRSSILKKIQADLEFAVEWLPRDVAPGAVSKAAAGHLLTKVYLANLEFDKAIASASEVINDGKYALMENRFGSVASDARFNVIWDLHQRENKSLSNNTEGILVVQDKYGYPGAQTGGTKTMRLYTPWWSHALWLKDPDGKRAGLDAPGNAQIVAFGRGVGMFRPSNYINYTIWENCGDDLRHNSDTNWMPASKILVNNPESAYYGQPVDVNDISDPIDTIRAIFPWPQYKIYVEDEMNKSQPQGGNSDWYVFRLAGTYLLRAEAYFWKGELGNAAADINQVRARAHAPLISSQDVTIDYILDERARELYLEAPRKTELTRIALILAQEKRDGYSMENISQHNFWYDRVVSQNNLYNNGIVWEENEYKISPFHIFWPIPQSTIDANTGGHINQNVGYAGSENNIAPSDEISDKQ